MFTLFFSALVGIRSWFQTRAALEVEILALRHQLTVLKRSQRGRLRLNSPDRLLWVLALDKDAPEPRAIQSPELGAVIEIAEVRGLHHRYERRAV